MKVILQTTKSVDEVEQVEVEKFAGLVVEFGPGHVWIGVSEERRTIQIDGLGGTILRIRPIDHDEFTVEVD